MKNSRKFGIILLFLLLFPTRAFAEAQKETALCSGTYFPIIKVTDHANEIEVPLKVTITSENGKTDRKKQVGIDGRDFEYDKKISLNGLDKEKLAEMGEIHFWSLEDGEALTIDEFKLETLDNIESLITFYNFEKNVQKSVHAFKSGDEIHNNKKYSSVRLQEYRNITGDAKERPWNIEHRTMLTYMIFMLLVFPVILVIALIIFVYLQTEQLDKIVRKKKNNHRILWLLLPALFTFGSESLATDFDIHEVYLTQEKVSELVKNNQLEDYLIEKSDIQNLMNLDKDSIVHIDTEQLASQVNQPREQVVRMYQSRSLKVGDYENYIVQTIILYVALIVIPLFYFLNKRVGKRQKY